MTNIYTLTITDMHSKIQIENSSFSSKKAAIESVHNFVTYLVEDKGMAGRHDYDTLIADRDEILFSSWLDGKYAITVEKTELLKRAHRYS